MQDYIARENIKRFKRQLAETSDARKRETLRQLLTDEEARLRQLESGTTADRETEETQEAPIH